MDLTPEEKEDYFMHFAEHLMAVTPFGQYDDLLEALALAYVAVLEIRGAVIPVEIKKQLDVRLNELQARLDE